MGGSVVEVWVSMASHATPFRCMQFNRSWKELGKGSIPVAVLHDESRNTYRVVAMDGQNAVSVGQGLSFVLELEPVTSHSFSVKCSSFRIPSLVPAVHSLLP